MCILQVGVILLCLNSAISKNDLYRAAVVEYSVSEESDFQKKLYENENRYLNIIRDAAQQDVDVLVFPEATLNYLPSTDRNKILNYAFNIPSPDDYITLCDTTDHSEILTAISCAAKTGGLYVVINVWEKSLCRMDKQCHPDGHQLYNTNVVFDRNGRIISKYRKTHLFKEYWLNTTSTVELATFKTDFNVTFGHMICFDLLFQDPGLVLQQSGIRNFVLPLMWYSELPFLTAVQYQAAWAYSSEANLLAAGGYLPNYGSGGSGIYSGRNGVQSAIITGRHITKLIIADIVKDPTVQKSFKPVLYSDNLRNLTVFRDNLDVYSTKFLDLGKSSSGLKETVCDGKFCCEFYVKTKLNENNSKAHYHYAFAVVNGVRTFKDVANGGIQSCGVIACARSDLASCATTTERSGVTFENIDISGSFTKTNAAQFSAILTDAMLPLSTESFSLENANGNVNLKLRQHNLITFGIFGRDFNVDNLENLSKTNFEEETNLFDENEIFDYLWIRIRIALVVISIYVLEQL